MRRHVSLRAGLFVAFALNCCCLQQTSRHEEFVYSLLPIPPSTTAFFPSLPVTSDHFSSKPSISVGQKFARLIIFLLCDSSPATPLKLSDSSRTCVPGNMLMNCITAYFHWYLPPCVSVLEGMKEVSRHLEGINTA